MKSLTDYLTMNVPGKMAFVNITPQVADAIKKSKVMEGIALINSMHITSSVFINDNESGCIFYRSYGHHEGATVTKPRIAIILSTTRAARFGHKAGQWIHDIASKRDDMEVGLIDLRDHPLPFFDEVATNAGRPTQNPEGVRWQKKIAQYDGYIFVTAEYNHGVPAVLKNALDYAYTESIARPRVTSAMAVSAAPAPSSSCGSSASNCRWPRPGQACILRAATSWPPSAKASRTPTSPT